MPWFLELGVSREWRLPSVAVAAGIAFSISSVVLLVMWVKQKFRITHTRGGWWRRARLKSLLDIGYPAAVEQVYSSWASSYSSC